MNGVRLQTEAGIFSLRHHFQIGSVAYPPSYPLGTGDSFTGGEHVEIYLYSLMHLYGVVRN